MREVLYLAERDFLERYLKEKATATLGDCKEMSLFFGSREIPPEAGTPAAVDKIYTLEGDTAHIKIEGVLSVDGPDMWDMFWGYGGASYKTIQAAMERAKNDPIVKSVIFDIDSPGGTLAGTDETWQAHKALAAQKPTEVRVGSRLASAAYYISTPANKILAASPTSQIGSIGVLVATYDYSKWEENIGIKEVIITSSNAPNKRPDISTKQGRDTIKDQLDAMERVFYSRVSEGRGVSNEHIAEHFGRGGMLIAQDPSKEHEDAIRSKMIDGLTTDNEAVNEYKDAPEIKNITTRNIDPEKDKAEQFEQFINEYYKFVEECIKAENGEIPERIKKLFNLGEQSSLEENNIPASAGTGGSAMTLQEFMAQNPAAKVEVDKLITEARESAEAEYSARVDKVLPIIESTAYPAKIKALACEALSGKKSMDAFDAAVTIYDTNKESGKSAVAQAETANLGSVTAEAPNLENSEEKAVNDAWGASIADAKARNEKARQEVR
jgi:ClpP class serine protease